MSQEHHFDSTFSAAEPDELPQAARVSGLAVGALLGGLVSIAAVASPVLCLVPLATVAMSLLALRQIARSEDPILGRKAAIAGLSLALLFAAWGLTKSYAQERAIRRQAHLHAEQWLDLVRNGRLFEAFELQMPQSARQPPGTNLEKYFEIDTESAAEMQSLFNDEPLKQIVEAGSSGRCEYQGVRRIDVESRPGVRTEIVTLRYILRYEKDGQQHEVPFRLGMGRARYKKKGEARWQARGVRAPRD